MSWELDGFGEVLAWFLLLLVCWFFANVTSASMESGVVFAPTEVSRYLLAAT